jgi:hypothetical protein
MSLLNDLMVEHGTDKQEALHGYAEWYERHLGPLRLEKINLLEVGVWEGASLRVWADYFPNGLIKGLDIEQRVRVNHPHVTQITGDVKDYPQTQLRGYAFDVVIDDGSHLGTDIVAAFNRLWPLAVKPGGWYIIEDWDVQWDPAWGGSQAGSPARTLLRDLVEDAVREKAQSVAEVHAYRQIVFIRKAS